MATVNQAALDLLSRHLKERQELGDTTVRLTPEGLAALHALGAESKAVEDQPAVPKVAPKKVAAAGSLVAEKATPPPSANLSSSEKATQIAQLKERVAAAVEPKALGTLRDTLVYSEGSPDADLMFIGEAPQHEDEANEIPFSGGHGDLFTKILSAMKLSRDDVYLTNLVKFRPKIGGGDGLRQGTSERKPRGEEMDACKAFLLEEIRIVQPKVIVGFGDRTILGLLGETIPLGVARGRFYEVEGIPFTATYAPAYVLRSEGLVERRKVWEDLLLVMEKAGMAINEKQRGFFGRK